MRSRSGPVLLFLFLLPLLTLADLPSCYRARCSHCRIQFIAQMCTQTCGNCPPQPFNGKAVNNAGTTNAVAHGKPTVYRTAEHIQILSQHDGQPQNAFSSSQIQIPAQPAASYQAPTPQQQQVAQPASNNYQTANTGFQPAPAQQQFVQQPQVYNNQFNQGQFLQQPQFNAQQGQFAFPSAPTVPPQQQFSGFQGAVQQPGFQGAVQQPNAQYANFGQSQQSGAFNPFQPFLQQSFQAQQPQTPYNPFTFPTLPPSATFAPFTHAPSVTLLPTMGTFPTFPPFPTHAPLTQSPQPPVTQPTPSAQPNYQQPQAGNNYVQSGQPHQAIIVEPQRPRQLYNTQQGQQISSQQGQYQVPQQPSPYLQPARSNSIPTVQVGSQIGRSIDSAPVQLEKQAYIGKGEPPAAYVANTCPKQPNWEPCISKDLANERFRNCCQRLGEGCSQLCNYDQSLTTLQLAVLTGRCPISKVADMMICASGYEDATPCCQAYNVFEPGFEHCRPYCNPAAGLPNDGMLAEKYKCLGKLSQIQRCFYISQRP